MMKHCFGESWIRMGKTGQPEPEVVRLVSCYVVMQGVGGVIHECVFELSKRPEVDAKQLEIQRVDPY